MVQQFATRGTRRARRGPARRDARDGDGDGTAARMPALKLPWNTDEMTTSFLAKTREKPKAKNQKPKNHRPLSEKPLLANRASHRSVFYSRAEHENDREGTMVKFLKVRVLTDCSAPARAVAHRARARGAFARAKPRD